MMPDQVRHATGVNPVAGKQCGPCDSLCVTRQLSQDKHMPHPESLEQQILELMDEQSRLAVEIRELQGQRRRDQRRIDEAIQRHRESAAKLVALLYEPLKKAFEQMRPRVEAGGVQYTEMVHDFFLRLMEGRVAGSTRLVSMNELRYYVATVLMNQFRDTLKKDATQQRHVQELGHANGGVGPEARQKQQYFEDRYATRYVDFLDEIETLEHHDDEDHRLMGRALLLRYVGGMMWGTIAQVLGISDERLSQLRKRAMELFRKREA
jgi:RNA polymerase sigma factor (sigma-70 family)